MKYLFKILSLLFSPSVILSALDPFIGKWNAAEHITIPAYGSYTYYYELATDASINGTGAGTDLTTIALPSDFPSGEYLVSLILSA